ncbi:MAG: FAD/NAD(P)-binding protein [Microcoleus sp.]
MIDPGIARLAAGCRTQIHRYRNQIFESHDQSGGLCRAWKRQRYTFEDCFYYLFGYGVSQPFYGLWEKLRSFQGRQLVHRSRLMPIALHQMVKR